jgi:hypothetical protein
MKSSDIALRGGSYRVKDPPRTQAPTGLSCPAHTAFLHDLGFRTNITGRRLR